MNNISIGDVVQLAGGSLPLTVISIKDGSALCCYMGFIYESYPTQALVRVVTQDQLDHKEYR